MTGSPETSKRSRPLDSNPDESNRETKCVATAATQSESSRYFPSVQLPSDPDAFNQKVKDLTTIPEGLKKSPRYRLPSGLKGMFPKLETMSDEGKKNLAEKMLDAVVAAAEELRDPISLTQDLVFDLIHTSTADDWRHLGAVCHKAHTNGDYTLIILASTPWMREYSCSDFMPQINPFRLR
jgi:hypothetical protein